MTTGRATLTIVASMMTSETPKPMVSRAAQSRRLNNGVAAGSAVLDDMAAVWQQLPPRTGKPWRAPRGGASGAGCRAPGHAVGPVGSMSVGRLGAADRGSGRTAAARPRRRVDRDLRHHRRRRGAGARLGPAPGRRGPRLRRGAGPGRRRPRAGDSRDDRPRPGVARRHGRQRHRGGPRGGGDAAADAARRAAPSWCPNQTGCRPPPARTPSDRAAAYGGAALGRVSGVRPVDRSRTAGTVDDPGQVSTPRSTLRGHAPLPRCCLAQRPPSTGHLARADQQPGASVHPGRATSEPDPGHLERAPRTDAVARRSRPRALPRAAPAGRHRPHRGGPPSRQASRRGLRPPGRGDHLDRPVETTARAGGRHVRALTFMPQCCSTGAQNAPLFVEPRMTRMSGLHGSPQGGGRRRRPPRPESWGPDLLQRGGAA